MVLDLLLPAMWRPKSCSGGSQAYTVSSLFLTSLILSVYTAMYGSRFFPVKFMTQV